MTTLMKVRRGDHVLGEGETGHVFVDMATRKSPIPEAIRRRLEPGLREPDGDGARHAAADP